MHRRTALSLLAGLLLAATSNANAWWGGGWNPFDPWDPRYWMEEFFGGGYYGGGPWGGYGGPWGGYGGPWGYGGYPYYGGYAHPYRGWGYPHDPSWGYAPYATSSPQATGGAAAK